MRTRLPLKKLTQEDESFSVVVVTADIPVLTLHFDPDIFLLLSSTLSFSSTLCSFSAESTLTDYLVNNASH